MSLGFEFTPEQKMIEEVVWRWASSWLEPQMEELYEKDQMPPQLFRELGKIGVNGIVFEEEYGGAGLGYVETLLVYETIGRVSNALAMTVGASQTLCFDNFRRNATEEQKTGDPPQGLQRRVYRLPGDHRAQRRLRCNGDVDPGREGG